MTPPHPDEFSNEMLEFLLKDPDLNEFVEWNQNILRSHYQLIFAHLPTPLSYRLLSVKL